MIEFGPWLPDLPDLSNPGVTDALGVLPSARGYLPWPATSAFSNALDARCRGAISAKDKDGNLYLFAGDAAKIYSLSADAFADVSKAGSPAYALATEEGWEFVQWGEDIIAASGVNAAATNNLQTITMGGSNFADLGGTPPQARHIAVVRDFVVVGNTYDSGDGLVPQRVRWSGKGNSASWTVSASTQADYEDSLSGGWVQRIAGGEYGLVFLENSVYRMSYIGSPVVWQFDEILPNRGTPAPGSVAQIGDLVFFLSQDGFEVITNGSESRPIGAQKIDRWFFDDFDAQYAHKMTSAVDPYNRRVFWAYAGESNSGGQHNRILCYDWSCDRWSRSTQTAEFMFLAATTGYTMDGLDSVDSNLDNIVESLDSRVWMGGAQQLGAFDGTDKLTFWSGVPQSGIIETAEYEINPGRRTMVRGVRPHIDGAQGQVEVLSRNRQQDSFSVTKQIAANSNGVSKTRVNARFHKFRIQDLGNDWTHIVGFDVDGSPVGGR